MAKRVYANTVKKWLIGSGVGAGTIVGAIFLYLSILGSITVTGYSGTQACMGTLEDPCYAYLNFTAEEDVFIYPVGYDPYGRDVPFDFDPNVKDWKLERSWGSGWREIPLDKACTGTWCGLSNSKDERVFSVAFREGRDYQLRITAYKNNPEDVITWSAIGGVNTTWDGINTTWSYSNPRENTQIEVTTSGATLSKWGDTSLRIPVESSGAVIRNQEKGIDFIKGQAKQRFYITPEGDLEWELVYNERPDSNVFNFKLEFGEGRIEAQGTLAEDEAEYIGEKGADPGLWDVCTDVECYDYQTGDYAYRPEEMINSFALYSHHSGNQYKNGRFAEIKRTFVIDGDGQKYWCESNLERITDNESEDYWKLNFIITCPEEVIQNAKLPLTLGPTVGYSSIGASTYSTTSYSLAFRELDAHPDIGIWTIEDNVNITRLCAATTDATPFIMGVYDNIDNGGAWTPTTRQGSATSSMTGGSGGYSCQDVDIGVGVGTFTMAVSHNGGGAPTWYYDSCSSCLGRGDAGIPSSFNEGSARSYLLSMYAEYDVCRDGVCVFDSRDNVADLEINENGLSRGDVGLVSKWNISELLDISGASVDSSLIRLYAYAVTNDGGGLDTDARAWYLRDQILNESSTASEVNSMTVYNTTNANWDSSSIGNVNLNITTIAKEAVLRGENFTIRIEDPDYLVSSVAAVSNGDMDIGTTPFNFPSTIDAYRFRHRAYATVTQRPYLMINYSVSEGGPTQEWGFVPPTPTENSTSDTFIYFNMSLEETCTTVSGGLDIVINGATTDVCSNCPSTPPGYQQYNATGLSEGIYDYSFVCTGSTRANNWTILKSGYNPIAFQVYEPTNSTIVEDYVAIADNFTVRVVSPSPIENITWTLYETDSDYLNPTLVNTTVQDITNAKNGSYQLEWSNLDGYYIWNLSAHNEYNTIDDTGDYRYYAQVTNALQVNTTSTKTNRLVYNESSSQLEFYWYHLGEETLDNCILQFDGSNNSGAYYDGHCNYNVSMPSALTNYTWYVFANDTSDNLLSNGPYWTYVYWAANGTVDGRWVMRAPVNETNKEGGVSYPCRNVNTGVSGFECGNGQDTSILVRATTLVDGVAYGEQDEQRQCGGWFQAYFDEYGYDQGRINGYYCRTWAFGSNLAINSHSKFSDQYEGGTYDPFNTRTAFNDLYNTSNEASFYTLLIDYDPTFVFEWTTPNKFWNLTWHVSGDDFQALMYKNQQSECFLNLADNATLQAADTDSDGLNDYDELFVYISNPYVADTDKDGHSDFEEVNNAKNPNDPYDWGATFKYLANESNITIYYKANNQTYLDWAAVLSNEYSAAQYTNVTEYDDNYTNIVETLSSNNAQINYHVDVNRTADSLIYLNVYFGGDFDAFGDSNNVLIHVKNLSGGEDYILSGRKGTSRALFFKQFSGAEINDVLDADNKLYYGVFINDSVAATTINNDFVQVWAITGENSIDLTVPTTASPLTTSNYSDETIGFDFYEQAVEIVSGVEVQNITAGDTLVTIKGEPSTQTEELLDSAGSVGDLLGIPRRKVLINQNDPTLAWIFYPDWSSSNGDAMYTNDSGETWYEIPFGNSIDHDAFYLNGDGNIHWGGRQSDGTTNYKRIDSPADQASDYNASVTQTWNYWGISDNTDTAVVENNNEVLTLSRISNNETLFWNHSANNGDTFSGGGTIITNATNRVGAQVIDNTMYLIVWTQDGGATNAGLFFYRWNGTEPVLDDDFTLDMETNSQLTRGFSLAQGDDDNLHVIYFEDGSDVIRHVYKKKTDPSWTGPVTVESNPTTNQPNLMVHGSTPYAAIGVGGNVTLRKFNGTDWSDAIIVAEDMTALDYPAMPEYVPSSQTWAPLAWTNSTNLYWSKIDFNGASQEVWYDATAGYWKVNVTMPAKPAGTYDLAITANTSTSGLITQTESNAIIYSAVESDSCTYGGSGNWEINMNDTCVITTEYNVTGNITYVGTYGNVTWSADVNASNIGNPPDNTTEYTGVITVRIFAWVWGGLIQVFEYI